MSDENAGKFVQFPLCWLAAPRPIDDVIDHGFDWGVINFLNAEETRDAEFEEYTDDFPLTVDSADTFKDHCLKTAQRRIGFLRGDIDSMLKKTGEVDRFCRNFVRHDYNVRCGVRIRSDLMFEVRNAAREKTKNGVMSEKDFRVLAGAYSLLGVKSYAKIGWPMFQARAAGHLSPGDLEKAKAGKMHGPIYTRRQIDTSLAHLVRFGWLRTAGWGNGVQVGERYWSHRLDEKALQESVRTAKLKRTKHAHSLARDNAFAATVQAEIAAAFAPNATQP